MNNLAYRATTGTIYAFIGAYLVTIIDFVAGVVLARVLLPEHFGVLSLAVFYLTAFSLFKNWGIEPALFYCRDKVRETFSTLFFLQLGLSIFGIVLALGSSLVLKKIYDPQIISVLLVLVAFAIVETLGNVPRTLIEKKIEFRSLSILEITATLVAAALALIIAIKGFGVWSLVVQKIGAVGFKTIGYWYLSHFRPVLTFDFSIAKWFIGSFGIPIFLAGLASLFLFQFDNFLIGTFISTAMLGFYTKAYSLATLPTQLITNVVSRVSLPVYSQLRGDYEKLNFAFSIFLKGIWRLALPVAVGLFVLAPEIIKLLIGSKWLPAAPLLRILIGYSLARILLDDTGVFFTGGLGKPKITTRILIIQAFFLVILGPVFIRLGQAAGVAVAVDLTMILGAVLALRRVTKELKLNLADIFVSPSIAGAGMFLFSPFIQNNVKFDNLLINIVVKAAFLSFTYIILLFVFEGRKLLKEGRAFLKYVKI